MSVESKTKELYEHSLLSNKNSLDLPSLKIFMETHVFAVWDFMSLVKSLQNHICPSTDLWMPIKSTKDNTAGLINEIVLYEESDVAMGGTGRVSHFDLYLQGMYEIGADTSNIDRFIRHIRTDGLGFAMAVLERKDKVAYEFLVSTFEFINTKKSHVIAATFLHGRENVIPTMFSSVLKRTQLEAPRFKYYLERHIELDGDEHGPAAQRLLESLCEGDPQKIVESEKYAVKAIDSRIKFLSGIEKLISQSKVGDDSVTLDQILNPFKGL